MTGIETLRAATTAAAEVFTGAPRRAAADAYLRQRGIDPANLGDEWLIGYAPPGWTRLVDRLRPDFPPEALIVAGLARMSSRDTLIDTFRDRIIFGICGDDGAVVGFIGRDLSAAAGAPRYLNTRQHALFDKSSLLFGAWEATQHDRAGQPVVVEGPLDALAIATRARAAKADLVPVAPCGTAFTDRQAQRVVDLGRPDGGRVVVALDGDAAGQAAALKAGDRLRRAGGDVRVASLPGGVDPAEYLANPATTIDAFRFTHAMPLTTVHVQQAIAAQGDRMQWIEGRLAAARRIADYLATYPPEHTARQIPWLAQALNLDPATITQELTEAYQRQTLARPAVPSTALAI